MDIVFSPQAIFHAGKFICRKIRNSEDSQNTCPRNKTAKHTVELIERGVLYKGRGDDRFLGVTILRI